MRVVVTGGAGFLGSHLCERLIRRGDQVVALDNFVTGDAANVAHLQHEPGFELHQVDVTRDVSVDGDVDLQFGMAARQLGEIGEQRGDEIAEVQLAGLHELADGVLGRLEGADEALADIAADLARLAGVVRQRRRDRLPAGDGRRGVWLRRSGSSSGRCR